MSTSAADRSSLLSVLGTLALAGLAMLLALPACSDKKPAPAPPAAAQREAEKPPAGDPERAAIIHALTQRFPELEACVQSKPEAGRPANEPIEVHFRVETDGKADQIEVKSENQVARECFTAWIQETEFPAPSKPVSITFPYQFR